MSLTFSSGPLSGSAPETVNYRIDGPAHKLLMQAFPRRLRAVLGGQTVFDSTRAMLLHETGLPPQVYVPLDDIRADLIQPTDHHTYCPFKGTASYWTVTAGGQVAENAIWAYPEPNDEAGWLEGYAGFYWNAMDEWYDEDERRGQHPRPVPPGGRAPLLAAGPRPARRHRAGRDDQAAAALRDRAAEPLLHPGRRRPPGPARGERHAHGVRLSLIHI